MNILDTIVKQKEKEIVSLKKKKNDLIAACEKPVKILNFEAAVSKPGKLNIIGEVKQASPSAGVIKKVFNPAEIARIYKRNGISAISVLTDENFFKGKLEYIALVKKAGLPVLRKDFIINKVQIYESLLAGSDAILLIAAILSETKLKKFIKLTHQLRMSALVETRTKEEVLKALSAGARIIGINNRDLKNFKIDLKTTEKMLKYIPNGKIVVSESGLEYKKDLLYMKKLGVNAVLIGTTFMKAADMGKKIKLLIKAK
ncbi:MAG: indole-3-glycerol phosphate synthase TrpC [Candidatus Omnitrophota bacterium]